MADISAIKLPNNDTYNLKDETARKSAGSTDSSSKIFIIGATSQTDSSQTYSQDTAYVGTDGHVYSNGKQVVNLSDAQALTNKTYEGYTLAAASGKAVDTTLSPGSSSSNLPTSAAVVSYVTAALTAYAAVLGYNVYQDENGFIVLDDNGSGSGGGLVTIELTLGNDESTVTVDSGFDEIKDIIFTSPVLFVMSLDEDNDLTFRVSKIDNTNQKIYLQAESENIFYHIVLEADTTTSMQGTLEINSLENSLVFEIDEDDNYQLNIIYTPYLVIPQAEGSEF